MPFSASKTPIRPAAVGQDGNLAILQSFADALTELQAAGLLITGDASGGGGGSITASQITDATTLGRQVLTASSAATARNAIGAGTGSSNLALGTTSSTAAPGDHAHDASGITSGVLSTARLGSGSPSSSTVLYGDGTWKNAPTGGGASGVSDVGANVPLRSTGGSTPVLSIDAASQSVPGSMSANDKTKLDGVSNDAVAGTASMRSLGTGSQQAAAGNHTHTASGISDSSATGRSVLTATDSTAARNAIGAGTSNLAIGTSSSTAKAGDYQPTSNNISDASTVGRSVLTGADATTIRTTLNAAGRALTQRNLTASYTLVLADGIDMVLHVTASGAITVTLPLTSSVAIPVEVAIPWRQFGAGKLTFAAGSGVTLVSRGSVFSAAGQYAGGAITKISGDTWLLEGDIAA